MIEPRKLTKEELAQRVTAEMQRWAELDRRIFFDENGEPVMFEEEAP